MAKGDVIMDEYRTQRELREEKEEKRLFKKMKERMREDI
jgi:hypothetical protein